MPTIADILKKTETWFRERGIDSPRRQAQAAVAFSLGLEPLQLVLQHDKPLGDEELNRIRPVVKRRAGREPWAYIEGSAGFHDFEFIVRPGVLCPRPDTESLVNAALELIPNDDQGEPFFVADVGSGSGCVGLSIAASRPQVRLYATDISDTALAVTRENVAEHRRHAVVGLDREEVVARPAPAAGEVGAHAHPATHGGHPVVAQREDCARPQLSHHHCQS